MSNSNVQKYLDLSTAHLTTATRTVLDAAAPITTFPHPEGYGWFVHVPEPEHMPPQPDLCACLQEARALGCGYILFDADADTMDGLATYED